MRVGERVFWASSPLTLGTVEEMGEGMALVTWDTQASRWEPVEALRSVDGDRMPNPMVYAPEVQDLEFTTRMHMRTGSPMMERPEDYRGDGEPGPVVSGAEDVYWMFRHMGELDREMIVVILLNVRGEMTGWKVVHVGELASVGASVRQMVKDALFGNAHGIIILHNHPSGDSSPSDADRELTEEVARLGGDWQVQLVDHVIVGRDRRGHAPFYSFRERGELEEPAE